MIVFLNKKISREEIKKASEEYDTYIKTVVDVENETLTAGGEWHFEGEELLLKMGSKQKDLWGGGMDLETKEIDYNSMINMRPSQDNPSRDILSPEIRKKFDKVMKKIFHD